MSLVCTASISSLKYWDPGNLLQIIGKGRHAEIRCVGRAVSQGDARCRWTIDRERQTKIEAKLEQIATRNPADITTEELRDLAELCLCRDWHLYQKEDTVHHWKEVVLHAAENSRNAMAEGLRNQKDEIAKLQEVLKAKEEDLQWSWKQYRSLEKRFDDTRLAQSKNLESQEIELLEIRQHLQSATDNAQSLKTAILDHHLKLKQITTALAEEKDRQIKTLEDEKEELKAKQYLAWTEADITRKDLAREATKTQKLVLENDALREKLRNYQSREEAQAPRELHPEDEKMSEKSTQEAQVTAEVLKLQNMKTKPLADLSNTKVTTLEADVSACWLHRIRSHMRGILLASVETVLGYNVWFVRLIESIVTERWSLIKRG
ncbi:uncharacterized protein ColSpa_10808 [Colletotrichum spaethianum]|uniref:Uncharacterized protein n=1 Tax=Colletotrichum spaethianum TaxID=700344 RepID=A0AA37URF3_9PEZI|nr:uncharacterized protein ColSpa_10808 [Colletotrichum spaethianum]GKT50627.1 hypothetical protein ColSpa_10808 [Colletotrichum spaethianum]